jgi:hypothetical protein
MRRGAAGALALLGLLAAALSCDKPTAPTRGDLSIEVRGLPDGVPFRVALIGPSGDSIAVTANGILRDLPGGTYQVRPSDPDVTPDDIASPADTAILVAGGTTAYIMLRYRFLTGGANISAFGLPDGDTARLHVRAPDSTLMTLRIPGLNRGLQVGVWRILEEPHRKNGDVYEFPPAGTFPVEAGPQATSFTLTYSLQSAKLNVRFRGYPPGLPKRATLIHGFYPDTFRILGDTMLTGVRPTWAYLRGGFVDIGPYRYASFTNTVVELPASTTPRDVDVNYGRASGALRIRVSGLPSGVVPRVRLTDWDSTREIALTSDTVPFLMAGGYRVEPIAFVAGGAFYDALPVGNISIAAESLTTIDLAYQDGATSFDAQIARVTVSQAIQTTAGSVPLLTGRPALVRVLALADRVNLLQPRVRIRVTGRRDGAFSTRSSPGPLRGRDPDGSPRRGLGVRGPRPPGRAGASGHARRRRPRPRRHVHRSRPRERPLALATRPTARWPSATCRRSTCALSPIRFSLAPPDVSLPPAVGGGAARRDLPTAPRPDRRVRRAHRVRDVAASPGPARWRRLDQHHQRTRGAARAGGRRPPLRWRDAGGIHLRHRRRRVHRRLGRRSSGNSLGSATAVLAHELGHNFGTLPRPPAGIPATLTPSSPRGDGSIGDLGWSAGSTVSIAASTPDLMSYCEPAWDERVYLHRRPCPPRTRSPLRSSRAITGDVLLVSGQHHRRRRES